MANIQVKPVDKLKAILNVNSVQQQFKNALAENSGAFVASIIDLYGSDKYLQKCDPQQVIMECLKAATLKLPINKQLGFAYVVPYKSGGVSIPQFQLGYKGYIQLAMRTGQYRFLNAGVVYEGVTITRNILTGEIQFTGEPTGQKAQGYFSYMRLVNGFEKSVYMTVDEVTAHAKRYSKSYRSDSSAWKTNFDEMAMKTTMRQLLSHYGFLSTEMTAALTSDKDDDPESRASNEIAQEANGEVIDIQAKEAPNSEAPAEPTTQQTTDGPDF